MVHGIWEMRNGWLYKADGFESWRYELLACWIRNCAWLDLVWVLQCCFGLAKRLCLALENKVANVHYYTDIWKSKECRALHGDYDYEFSQLQTVPSDQALLSKYRQQIHDPDRATFLFLDLCTNNIPRPSWPQSTKYQHVILPTWTPHNIFSLPTEKMTLVYFPSASTGPPARYDCSMYPRAEGM